MKLWLDDVRKPPWGYDLHAKTAAECIEMLVKYGDEIEHVSLDHDLADEHYKSAVHTPIDAPADPLDRSAYKEQTGYAVLEWMHANDKWCIDISVHSLNAKGAEDMMTKLRNRAPEHVQFRRVWPGQPVGDAWGRGDD